MVMVGSMFNATHLRKILTKVKTKSDIVLNDLSDVQKNDLSASVDKIVKFAKLLDECQGAGFHNCIYRGKNLGSVYTGKQKEAIRSGTFDDLFIGDYWSFSDVSYTWEDDVGTVHTDSYTGNMIIADFDYYLNKGNTDDSINTKHHLFIIPEKTLFYRAINDEDTINGGYKECSFRTKPSGISRAVNLFTACFGENTLLPYKTVLMNTNLAEPNNSTREWVISNGCELLTCILVFGNFFDLNIEKYEKTIVDRYTMENSQLNLFRHRPDMISNRQWYWLQDTLSNNRFCTVSDFGPMSDRKPTHGAGIRPSFILCAQE